MTMFGYSIQSSQIDSSSVWCLFTYKLLAFPTFCFQLIVQLLLFSFVRFLTNNSFHIFEASTKCWVEILKLGTGRCWYLILLIKVIFNRFDWLYILLNAGKTNSFPRLQVISKFLNLILLSSKMVFAFEWSVKDKRKCIQGPSSRFYSCWMCCWQKINNTSFYGIIYCVYPGLLLQLFHGWQCNYILLTTFLFTNVEKKYDFLFCNINLHDIFFLPINNWL